MDFGKFVTSAGAEVIEAKDNWNYSRSLLFRGRFPTGTSALRTSMPVSKTETIGVQVVNGWNNVTKNNGGVTIGVDQRLGQAQVHLGPELLHRPGEHQHAPAATAT